MGQVADGQLLPEAQLEVAAAGRQQERELEGRLLGFQRRYQQTAMPFDWRYTRADLDRLLRRLDARAQRPSAA